jgi:hypothetical protein
MAGLLRRRSSRCRAMLSGYWHSLLERYSTVIYSGNRYNYIGQECNIFFLLQVVICSRLSTPIQSHTRGWSDLRGLARRYGPGGAGLWGRVPGFPPQGKLIPGVWGPHLPIDAAATLSKHHFSETRSHYSQSRQGGINQFFYGLAKV